MKTMIKNNLFTRSSVDRKGAKTGFENTKQFSCSDECKKKVKRQRCGLKNEWNDRTINTEYTWQ